MGARKSEILPLWNGPGAKLVRQALLVDGMPGLTSEDGVKCKLVAKYKHLGSMVTATPSAAVDIRERMRKASAVFFSLKRKVFSVQAISKKLRLQLYASLVLSVLFYNSELWVPTQVQLAQLHTLYMRHVRVIAGEPRAPIPGRRRCTDLQVLLDAQWPSIENRLQRRRLGYVKQLVLRPFNALLAVLQPHTEQRLPWCTQALEDLTALQRWASDQPRSKAASQLAQLGSPYVNSEGLATLDPPASARLHGACTRGHTRSWHPEGA